MSIAWKKPSSMIDIETDASRIKLIRMLHFMSQVIYTISFSFQSFVAVEIQLIFSDKKSN